MFLFSKTAQPPCQNPILSHALTSNDHEASLPAMKTWLPAPPHTAHALPPHSLPLLILLLLLLYLPLLFLSLLILLLLLLLLPPLDLPSPPLLQLTLTLSLLRQHQQPSPHLPPLPPPQLLPPLPPSFTAQPRAATSLSPLSHLALALALAPKNSKNTLIRSILSMVSPLYRIPDDRLSSYNLTKCPLCLRIYPYSSISSHSAQDCPFRNSPRELHPPLRAQLAHVMGDEKLSSTLTHSFFQDTSLPTPSFTTYKLIPNTPSIGRALVLIHNIISTSLLYPDINIKNSASILHYKLAYLVIVYPKNQTHLL